MTTVSGPRAHDRLVELVVILSGANSRVAGVALDDAIGRNGDSGDNLLNVADAIIRLRGYATRGKGMAAAR